MEYVFSKNQCVNCGRKLLVPLNRTYSGKCLCDNCYNRLRIDKEFTYEDFRSSNRDELVKRLKYVEDTTFIPFDCWHAGIDKLSNEHAISLGFVKDFTYDEKFCCLCFNDESKIFAKCRGIKNDIFYKNDLFNYNDINSFELLLDGHCEMKGGVGMSLVGGLLLGTVGAVAGAASRKLETNCSYLIIKILTNTNTLLFPFIRKSTPQKSTAFNSALSESQMAMGKLQQIVDSQAQKCDPATQDESIISELERLESLLSNNSISTEEFTLLKNRLINKNEKLTH